LNNITQASGVRSPALDQPFLIDHGQNRAGDHKPILTQSEGNNGLDIGIPNHAAVRPGPEIHIALDRHADEIGNRVSQLFGEIGCGFRRRINSGRSIQIDIGGHHPWCPGMAQPRWRRGRKPQDRATAGKS